MQQLYVQTIKGKKCFGWKMIIYVNTWLMCNNNGYNLYMFINRVNLPIVNFIIYNSLQCIKWLFIRCVINLHDYTAYIRFWK